MNGSKDTAAATIDACTRAIQSGDYGDQDLSALYHARGYSWSWTSFADRDDRALKDFAEAIRANPKAGGSLLNRSHIYNQRHDYDRAIADVNRAFEGDLSDYGKQVGFGERGYAYQAKGDNDRAIADYTASIRLNANNYVALTARCNAYFAKGDLDGAIADCGRAIALHPNYRDAYFNRGYAYQAKGDFDRAIADYDRMVALDPKDWDAYSNRATAYLAKGDFRRFIADLAQRQALSWLAIIVFLAAGVWLCCRTGMHARGRWAGRTLIEICEQEVVGMQHRNAALEKIAAALERRSSG
ncbi:tetratricopeptide repeat protein [Bradyrhizobium sp. AS23.2]|uniref:tetratricopeptide repeat protein n=1 Tax=Bradyrhizobium sp. AS23.2 TaxID=1680155 RepID=UPI0014310C2C|nr:tetratricopeptide repeat protein [Bradyrhizobium sp. AS23.2]